VDADWPSKETWELAIERNLYEWMFPTGVGTKYNQDISEHWMVGMPSIKISKEEDLLCAS
jgi:hypothetical protein